MSTGTMSSFSSGFNETNPMFLEFSEELDNPTEDHRQWGTIRVSLIMVYILT